MNTFFLPTAAPRTAPLCFTVFRTCRKPCGTGVWPGGDRLAPTIVRVPYRTGTKEQSTQRKKRTKAEITQSPCVRDGGECDFVELDRGEEHSTNICENPACVNVCGVC